MVFGADASAAITVSFVRALVRRLYARWEKRAKAEDAAIRDELEAVRAAYDVITPASSTATPKPADLRKWVTKTAALWDRLDRINAAYWRTEQAELRESIAEVGQLIGIVDPSNLRAHE